MSRITKQIAEVTANELVKSKKEKIKILESEFKKKLYQMVLKNTPDDVVKFYKKHPNFMKTNFYVEISGNGFEYQRITLDSSFPSKNGDRFQLLPDVETAKELLSSFNQINDLKEQSDRLKSDLENAIFNLRTYKSVQENFPEAFLLLPKIVNNSVAINLSDIRNRIKN
jgi:hypothetical protein